MQGYKNLFPDYDKFIRPYEKREYVEQRLLELVRADPPVSLLVTQLCNQEKAVRRQISHVLTGIRVENGQHMPGQPIPHELRSHMVRVRAMKGEEIKYKAGMKPSHLIYRGRDENRRGIQQQVDHWEAPCGEGATEGELDLPTAWRVMGYGGKDCLLYRSSKLTKKHEKYVEVDREPATGDPPTRRRAKGAA